MTEEKKKKIQANIERTNARAEGRLSGANTNRDRANQSLGNYFAGTYIPQKANAYTQGVSDFNQRYTKYLDRTQSQKQYQSPDTFTRLEQQRQSAYENPNKQYAQMYARMQLEQGNNAPFQTMYGLGEASEKQKQSISGLSDYYSQFGSQEGYNNAMEQQRLLNYDVPAAKQRLEQLKSNQPESYGFHYYYSQVDRDNNGYPTDYNEWERQVKALETEISQAEQMKQFVEDMKDPINRAQYDSYNQEQRSLEYRYSQMNPIEKTAHQIGQGLTNLASQFMSSVAASNEMAFGASANSNKYLMPGVNIDSAIEKAKANREFASNYADYVGRYSEYYKNGLTADLKNLTGDSTSAEVISNALTIGRDAVMQAIPSIVLAMVTGGASAGATAVAGATKGASVGAKALAIAKNLANNIIGNPLSFGYSFMMEGGSAYNQVKAEGGDDLEAAIAMFLTGMPNAIIEVGGGIEALPKDKSARGIRNWLKTIAKSGAEEGLEEVKQGIVSELVSQAMDGKIDIATLLDPSRMVQEFYGGFVGGAGGSAIQQSVAKRVGDNGKINLMVNGGYLENIGKTIIPYTDNSEIKSLYEEVNSKVAKGKKVSRKTYLKLWDLAADVDNDIVDSSISQNLVKLGVNNESVNEAASVVKSLYDGNPLTIDQAEIIADNDKLIEIFDTHGMSAASLVEASQKDSTMQHIAMLMALPIGTVPDSENRMRISEIDNRVKKAIDMIGLKNTTSAMGIKGIAPMAIERNGVTEEISIADSSAGRVLVRTPSGETFDAEDAPFARPETQTLVQLAGDYNTDTANTFVNAYPANMDMGEYASLFADIYNLAKTSKYSLQGLYRLYAPLTSHPSVIRDAYNAAIHEIAESRRAYEEKQASRRAKQKRSKGKLEISEEAQELVKKEHKTFADFIAKATKYTVRIIFDNEKMAQGTFDSTETEIVVNLAKGDFFSTMLHEVTHFIELNNVEGYNAFANEVMKYLSTKGILKETFERYAVTYSSEIESIDELSSEVVANAAESLMKSEDFLKELFTDKDFIQHIEGTEAQSFAQKVIAKLKEILDSIKQFMADATLNHTVAEVFAEDTEQLNRMVKLWTDAFKGAAMSEVQSIAQKNTDTESSGGKVKSTIKLSQMEDVPFNDSVDKIMVMTDEQALEAKRAGEYIKILDETPQIVVEKCNTKNLPVIIRFDALYLATRHDGVLEGHYHNLGTDMYKLSEKIADPLAIIEMDNGRINVISEIKEKNLLISVELSVPKDINKKNDPYNLVISVFYPKGNYLRNIIRDHGISVKYKKEDLSQVNPQLYEWLSTINDKSSDNNISQPLEIVNPDNKNSLPETDSKGKFSLSEPVEQIKDLIAVHNLDEAKLKSVFELGGFAMPSIAVTRADMGHGEFGEISVVFGKETIDPQASESNKVYSSDAWTPTFPTVEYKLNQKSFEHLKEVYKKIAHKFGYDEARPLYTYANESDLRDTLRREKGTEGLISLLTDDTKLMQLYLLDKTGQKVAPVTVEETNRIDDTDAELYDYLIKRLGEDVVKKVKAAEGFSASEYRKKYFNAYGEQIMDAYGDFYAENYGFSEEQVNNLFENFPTTYSYIQLMKKVLSYLENGAETVIQKEDTEATNKKIIETARKSGYDEWIRDLFGNISEKKGIRNNKDEFTNAGNRRGFEALHYEFTLENVVKAMMEQGEKGISAFQSNIFGASAQNYGSISDIKADSGRLQQLSQEEIDEIRKEFTARFNDIVDFFYPKDNWSAKNTAREVLIEAVAKRKTKSGIASYIRKEAEGWANYSDIVVEDLIELVSDISKMPTTYFEAKPQRVVGFEEIKYAVVPDNISEDLKKKLTDNGVSVVEYEQGDESDRVSKLNSLDDVKFSLPESDTASYDVLARENEDLKAQVEALENEMKLTKGHKVKPEAVKKLARKLLREYSSTMDVEELSAELEKIFNYVADTENASADIASKAMYSLAKRIINESRSLDTTLADEYKHVTDYLRKVKIRVSPGMEAELDYLYGKYNNFRRANFGRLSLSRDNGSAVDSVWQELNSLAPELFPEEAFPDSDMLPRIAEALDMIAPEYVNPYGQDTDSFVSGLASEIFDSYFDTPEIRTFADKKAAELRKAVNKSRQHLAQLRAKDKARYQERYEKLKADSKEKLNAVKADNKRKTAEKLLKQKAKYQNMAREKAEKQRETAEKSKLRHRIEKNSKTMMKWLNENSDKHHVPEVLRETTATFLSALDFVSFQQRANERKGKVSQSTTSWNEALRNLKEIIADYIPNDYGETKAPDFELDIDPDFMDRLSEFIRLQTMPVKPIPEMNSEQLREIDYIVTVLKSAITTANSFYLNRMAQNVAEIGGATISQLQTKKSKRLNNNAVDKLLNMHMLDSGSFFRELGPAAESIYAEIREGFNKRVRCIEQAQKYMQELLKEVDVSDWTGDKATVHTFKINGEELKMTTAQMMSLYELWKRKQAQEHITKGGIVPTEIKLGKKLLNKVFGAVEPVRLSETDLVRIFSELTPQQREIADKMQKFLSKNCSDWGNEVSMAMYGYRKFTEPDYFPITSSDNEVKSSDGNTSQSGLYKIKNQGMTKATVKGANNAIQVDDIFNTFTTHVVEMADYNAYAMPLSDAMKWYNYKVRDTAGRMHTIKGEMERTYGSQAKAYFIQLIKDINGDAGNATASEISTALLGKMKAASVAGNVRVALQQPTSIARAMVLMDPQYIGLGVTNMLKNPNKAIKEAQEHSSIAQWKSWGYFDTGLGKSLKEVITGQTPLRDKIVEKTMILAAYGDKVTWGALWEACKLEVAKNISPDSNGYMEAVTKRFDEIIDKTQVVDTVLHRSQIMRSKDTAVKMATSFMSEPTKTYNLMRNAITDMYHNRTKESVTRLARTTSAVMFTAVLTAAAAALSDAFRDDDKSKDWGEKYIDNFFENIADNVNPLNMIPYFKDIVSAIQGYDVERSDVAALVGFGQFVMQLFGKVEDGKEINFFNTVYDMSRYVSQFTGIPIFNLLREADSVIDIFADPLFRKDKTKAADVYVKLYDALISDNDAETDKMYQKLIEDGKDLQAIESGLRTQLLNPESEIYEERIVEAAKARLDGNTAEYMRLMKEVIADTGLSQDFWVKTVNTQINHIRNDGKELSEDKEFLIKNGLSADMVDGMTEQQIKETVKQYQTSSYKDLTAGDSMSLYDMNDLATAVTKGDTESFAEVYQDILEAKVDELLQKDNLLTMKKAEEKAKSSIKSSITSKIKPIVQDLYKTNKDKFAKLRTFLMKYLGYDSKTVNNWTNE